MRCPLAGSKLTTREVMAELRLGVRQLHARRTELGLTWRTEPWGGRRRVSLYDAASVGRAAALLEAERAARPWDERRIIAARQSAAQRRGLGALTWELVRSKLRLDLSNAGADFPLRDIPRGRLAAARAVVEAAIRRMS